MAETKRKPVIGITGGVGSGKTTVAQHLGRLGAVVLDADRIGHEVLRRPEVKQAARQCWGDAIFGLDGEIDRSALAAIVFGATPRATEERMYLEQLVHPLIGGELERRLALAQQRPDVPAIVLDAALLLEAGWHKVCTCVIFVETPEELRRQRRRLRWTDPQREAREAAQKPLSLKRQSADYVVDNSGPLDQTLRQVQRLFSDLTSDPPRRSSPA